MKKRYLLTAAVILGGFGLFQIASTRGEAIKMAQKIIAKDTIGDDTTLDIAALTTYVHGHSRTSVSFFLQGSYDRAVTAAQVAAAGSGANASVYAAAQKACTVANPVTTANCITAYVQNHAAPGTQPKALALPDRTIFQRDIQAPGWTTDLAGLALLAAVALFALLIYLAIFNRGKHLNY